MISVIIVNYNTSGILAECIESIYRFEKDEGFEIIVVDNKSDAANAALLNVLGEKYKAVKIIRLGKKVSFSEANNTGYAESARNGYTLIMNPDIIFTEPLFAKLEKIMMENPGIGALCPLLLGEDGKFQYSYFQRYPTLKRFIYFDSVLAKLFDGSEKRRNKYLCNLDIETSSDELQYVGQIPCAFFFTTPGIFRETGMMDISYELFFEDVDISYRMSKTYKLAVVPYLKVNHLSGASFRTEDNWWMHGRFLSSMINFFEIHYGRKSAKKLECFSALNSRIIILTEHIKALIGKKDEYRMKKHKYFLNLLGEKK